MSGNDRYITNATANSIAFYAISFLNNQGYSPQLIRKMREKFSLENLDRGYFEKDELLECLGKQSAYFLNLYVYLNNNDRFKSFTETIEKQGKFNMIFAAYKNFVQLNNIFDRKIFHNHLDCDRMKKDYEDEKMYHQNTGIFGDKSDKNKKYYSLPENYLVKLGMRQCNNCYNMDIPELSEDEFFKLIFDNSLKKKR